MRREGPWTMMRMTTAGWLGLGAALFAILTALPSQAQPSYSCSGNLTPTERAICGSAQLAHLDSEMAASYRRLRDSLPASRQRAFRADQLEWQGLRNGCGANRLCLAIAYRGRIAEFRQSLGEPASGATLPAGSSIVSRKVLPDGTLEIGLSDGSKRLRRPNGSQQIIWPDGTMANTLFMQVSFAGLPQLPPSLADWGDRLDEDLLGILRNILTDQEMTDYMQTEAGKDYYERLDWRLRSIGFLTQPDG